MNELIYFDRKKRLESILNHIKKLDYDDLHQIKEAILQQEFELDFNSCIPSIFETKIKTMKYKSSHDNPNWEYSDGIKCKFKMEFDNDCSIDLYCEYTTYYDGGDLEYTDIDNNRSININIGQKTYTIDFDADNYQTIFVINNDALKLLDSLSIDKSDSNKKCLGILIYNIVGITKPEDYHESFDIMSCDNFDDIVFIYEPY
ncbi:hypothetical protein qu_950 [Acanthamoeba polyphaga mimivirus]|nr:hypothetical protein [Mimivirus reunion]WMV62284.1 hypothetical protein qu_950 [Mimivirus sp.]WMV63261.1 hypothetical protein qu_950 [Acanthamoeba polyphaga mimivirus]WMV64238.1 hypothetical protein qu_950 [Mimivirus sp.]